MANLTALIESAKIRAADLKTRSDHREPASSALPATATAEELNQAENLLGFRLPKLLSRLYSEVGNGGFGPGYGLIGLANGHLWNGQSIVDLYRSMRSHVAPGWS